MNDWIARVQRLLAAGTPVVRMAVAGVQGSAPREPGASLLYWRDADGQLHSHGSVGGGRLEAHSMEIAQYLLDCSAASGAGSSTGSCASPCAGASAGLSTTSSAGARAAVPAGQGRRRVQRFTLGASLGQCCGGVVQMYWERFDHPAQAQFLLGEGETLRYCALDGSDREWQLAAEALAYHELPAPAFTGRAGLVGTGPNRYFVERLGADTTPLWIHGAGHVGRALVQVLADLPFDITWIDNRPDMLAQGLAELPAPRRDRIVAYADEPDSLCTTAPAGAWHLVMTHCHDLDLRICQALLADAPFGFLGLIGSQTKAARFRHRLRDKGVAPGLIARVVCPIGIVGIDDKRPAAIAIAVAAQLLQQLEVEQRAAAPVQVSVRAGVPAHG